MSTFKFGYLLIVIFIVGCSNSDYQSPIIIKKDIDPINAIIWKNHILISNNSDIYPSMERNPNYGYFINDIIALNYGSGLINEVLSKKMSQEEVSDIHILYNTLITYSRKKKSWLRWSENEQWEVDTNLNQRFAFLNKIAGYNRIIYLDEQVTIVQHTRGEFGYGTIFINHQNNTVYGCTFLANKAQFFNGQYYLTSSYTNYWEEDKTYSEIIKIPDFTKLPIITYLDSFKNNSYLLYMNHFAIEIGLVHSLNKENQLQYSVLEDSIMEFDRRRSFKFNKRLKWQLQQKKLIETSPLLEFIRNNDFNNQYVGLIPYDQNIYILNGVGKIEEAYLSSKIGHPLEKLKLDKQTGLDIYTKGNQSLIIGKAENTCKIYLLDQRGIKEIVFEITP
jgi:hypothetical protein